MTEQWTMPRDMARFSSLEAALLQAIHAAGLPEPVAEHAFDKCCPHPKKEHDYALDGEGERMRDVPCCLACLGPYLLDGREWDDDRELSFHDYRKGRAWRADFAWPAAMLLVECEGGIHSGGRHVRGTGYEADLAKYNRATELGYRVLRFSASQIESGEAVELIERVMEGHWNG